MEVRQEANLPSNTPLENDRVGIQIQGGCNLKPIFAPQHHSGGRLVETGLDSLGGHERGPTLVYTTKPWEALAGCPTLLYALGIQHDPNKALLFTALIFW